MDPTTKGGRGRHRQSRGSVKNVLSSMCCLVVRGRPGARARPPYVVTRRTPTESDDDARQQKVMFSRVVLNIIFREP